jgi:hypothetical protein
MFAMSMPDFWHTSTAMEICMLQYYLQAHAKVCFSEDGDLYKFVLTPATSSPRDQESYMAGHPGLAQKIQI